MKKFIFPLTAVAFLALAILTSCEDKEKSISSEIQRDAIVTALSKYDELSEFIALLQELYIADIQTEEFTVFAVKNEGMSKSALKSTNEGINLKRHIVARKYSKSSLTDGQQLVALDGTVLKIIIMGERVYVNGVELGEEIQVDNSVAFIVEKPITTSFNTTQYSFTVYECNAAWSPDNNNPYQAVSGASISLLDSLGRVVGPYTTGTDGKLTVTLVKGLYFYKVTKDNSSYISKDGYIIAGIFTTQKEIDDLNNSGFQYPTQSPAVLGGLKFVDYNGDARINNDDKPLDGFAYLWPYHDVYIATADFAPTYKP